MPYYAAWLYSMTPSNALLAEIFKDAGVYGVERPDAKTLIVTMREGISLPCGAIDRAPNVTFTYFVEGTTRVTLTDQAPIAQIFQIAEPNPETFVEPDDFDEILNGRDTPPNPALQQLFESSSHGVDAETIQQVFRVEPDASQWVLPSADNLFPQVLISIRDAHAPVPLWHVQNAEPGHAPAGTRCRILNVTGTEALVTLSGMPGNNACRTFVENVHNLGELGELLAEHAEEA